MVLPDSTFTETDTGNGGLVIAVNSAAGLTRRERDRNGSQFIDVSYPGLNSTIHFTFTPVNGATAGEVIGNRMERIGLNLGASEAELLEFDSPAGFENKVFVSRGDISTPVQFISTDGHSTVVSGAAFVSTASAATADSITPVVDMLRRDIVHALKTMHR